MPPKIFMGKKLTRNFLYQVFEYVSLLVEDLWWQEASSMRKIKAASIAFKVYISSSSSTAAAESAAFKYGILKVCKKTLGMASTLLNPIS